MSHTRRSVCSFLTLAVSMACSPGTDREHFVADAGPDGDSAVAPRPDEDPPHDSPPPAQLFAHAGWDTPVDARFDPETGAVGAPCREGALEYISSPAGRITTAKHHFSTVDHVLATLGLGGSPFLNEYALDRNAEVRAFAEGLVDDGTTLLTLFGPHVQEGVVTHERFAADKTVCDDPYVESVTLGARFSYGLRLKFKHAEDRQAFVETHPFATAYWASDLDDVLRDADLEEVEDWLEGKIERLDVVVFQVSTKPSDLSAVVARSRCSERELEGCRALLGELGTEMDKFYASLSEPSVDDYGGWAPMTLVLENTDLFELDESR